MRVVLGIRGTGTCIMSSSLPMKVHGFGGVFLKEGVFDMWVEVGGSYN